MSHRWLLMAGLAALLAACGQGQHDNKDYASMNKIPMRSVCVGRMMVDLPKGGSLEWQQQFDYAKVSKLPASIDGEPAFWQFVSDRKEELEHPTSMHPHGVPVVSKKYDQNAEILLIHDPDAEELGYSIDTTERYLWVGHWGYKYETGALSSKEAESLLPDAVKTFKQIEPISNYSPPSKVGFCLDSAMVVGKIGPIWSATSATVPGWKDVSVDAGAREDDGSRAPLPWQRGEHKSQLPDPFHILQMKQDWANESEKSSDDDRVVSFDVLRKQEKTLAGMTGQETAIRIKLANGQVYYRFDWNSIDDNSRSDKSGFSLDLEAGDYNYTPSYAPPPPKEDLLALWDAMLSSLKPRPGAH